MDHRAKSARAKERALTPTREAITFAARCSMLRRALHLSQAGFADLLNRHWLTVSRWERMAGHLPSPDSMARFEVIEQEYRRMVEP